MDKLVRVGLPLELKEDEDLVIGYANKAIIDDSKEIIPAEVWLSGLQRYFREGLPVKLLHRPGLIVGDTVWLRLSIDGLILASKPRYPEIAGLIKRGILGGYSVGFYPRSWIQRDDGVVEYTDLELVEVSYVDEPMNRGSYFQVVPKMLEGKEVHFDPITGTVTVLGLKPDEMATLVSLLQGALAKAGVPSGMDLQAIQFKAAGMADKADASPAGMRVQTVLCPRNEFGNVEEAAAWCKEHGFKADKVDVTDEYYRFRQFSPDRCEEGTFRTIELGDRVKAVVCRPQTDRAHCSDELGVAKGECSATEDSPMSLLKKIWDFLRGPRTHEEKEEVTNMPEDKSETPPVEKAEDPPKVETVNPEIEAKFTQVASQVVTLEARVNELTAAVQKLAEMMDRFVPAPNSRPVLDTSQEREPEQKYVWGFFGPTG